MSTSATLFAIYVFIGLACLVVAVAARSKERRAKDYGPLGPTELDAAVILFIALLWPIWLLWTICKSEGSSTK